MPRPIIARHVLHRFLVCDMPSYAAAVAYHVFFSALPFTIFLIALLGFLDLSTLFDWLRQRSHTYFLDDTVAQINGVLDQLQQRRTGILSASALGALWAAGSAMRAVMHALHILYGVADRRPWWRRYLVSVAWTVPLGLALACVVAMVVVEPNAMRQLAQWLGVDRWFAIVWAWYWRWPAATLLLGAIIVGAYRIGPCVRHPWRALVPGAVVTVLAWMAISVLLNAWVRHVAGYDRLYGSVGTVLVLALYVYSTTVMFLFGAAVNASWEQADALAARRRENA